MPITRVFVVVESGGKASAINRSSLHEGLNTIFLNLHHIPIIHFLSLLKLL